MSKGLFRSGMIVSAMTMISRILGLVRDAVVANLLGASAAADVFYLLTVFPIFYDVYLQRGLLLRLLCLYLAKLKNTMVMIKLSYL